MTLKRAAEWQLPHPIKTEIRLWPIAPFYNELVDVSAGSATRKPVAGLEVAIGLVAQTSQAKLILAPERGVMAVW